MKRACLIACLLAVIVPMVAAAADDQGRDGQTLITAGPSRQPITLSLAYERVDNGLPRPRLVFEDSWVVRRAGACAAGAGAGEVVARGAWSWNSFRLTVGPRSYRLRVLLDGAAILIVDWTEGTEAGLVHAVDVYPVPLADESTVNVEPTQPVARLRRPFRSTRRELRDVLVGDGAISVIIDDLAGALEFRLDLEKREWREVTVTHDPVQDIVERQFTPFFPPAK